MIKRKIIIVGGGTAGWMTAAMFALRWIKKGFEINLVESNEIGTIGVGEGATPIFMNFLRYLGVDESEWMPECNASYKNGITFKGWSTISQHESYFHPFFSQLDHLNSQKFLFNIKQRQKGFAVDAHIDKFSIMAQLASKNLAPITPPEFPFDMKYSYHFDSALLGKFLKGKALEFGATHIESRVISTLRKGCGNIEKLITDNNTELAADFFVDCTGFHSLLMQKSLQVPFINYGDRFLNNAAVAIPTPMTQVIPSYTLSTALSRGWAWKIPLTTRFGNGYAYSNNHISSEQAEKELREHTTTLDSQEDALHLKMKLGRLEDNWQNNCVAVGLSQGFIEPLEATGIEFIGKTIMNFIHSYEMGNFTNENKSSHNKAIKNEFEHVSDYIQLHYLTNTRTDSDYWRDARNTKISTSLENILGVWSEGGDLTNEINQQGIDKYYHSLSWYAMFSGVGILPKLSQCRKVPSENKKVDMQKLLDFTERCCLNFKDHRNFLSVDLVKLKT